MKICILDFQSLSLVVGQTSSPFMYNGVMKKIFALLFLLILIAPNRAFAQEVHLGVEPTLIQIDATPPASIEAPFIIRNLSESSIKLSYKLIPIEADNNGQVKLLFNKEEDLSSVIKSRLNILSEDKVVSEIELRANETKELRLFLDVKKGDPVGDYYFSLVFLSGGKILDETSTSAIPGGIAINTLVSIGPKVAATGEIQDFTTSKYLSSGPVPFSLLVRNTGKHLIQPRGFISVKNMFGKEVGKLELLPQYVLAEGSRYLIDSSQASPSSELDSLLADLKTENPISIWKEKFLLGSYTATARITLEDNGAVVTKTIHFFAFPVQILLIISAIIFAVLGVAFKASAKLRSRRR